MSDDQAQAIIDYVNARIDREFADRELDSDGYTTSSPRELRKEKEAESNLRRALR